LINVHDLVVTNPSDPLSLKLSLATSQDEDVQAELDAIAALSRELLRVKLEVPPPPQPMAKNQRSDLIHNAKEQGNQLFRKGQFVEAAGRYTLAIQLSATRPMFEGSFYPREELAVTFGNRCVAYTSSGQLDLALLDADASLRAKKDWPKGHYRRGKVLLAMGKLQEAKEAYLLGLEFQPDEKVASVAERLPELTSFAGPAGRRRRRQQGDSIAQRGRRVPPESDRVTGHCIS
jgi:translocation protein SEC72